MDPANIILTAVVGALTGLGAAFLKNTIDYRHEVRSDLWNKRFESYIRIWKLMQLIPLWPKNEKLTYKGLYEISMHFQNWYFQDGGILLSTPSRKNYGDMQEAITKIRSEHEKTGMDALVNNEDYKVVQSACSSLRTAITNELLSRKTTK
ncbi:MAG TPA: hypothetical protein VGQ09_01845 [Chitinophagaceae bacterium]|jgi:hypothetical protein|nr:hypothetical protein [Chitinophagaceae bacterium]